MSLQAARVFWKKANTDLVARIISTKDSETGWQLPKEARLGFTIEEFRQVAAEKVAAQVSITGPAGLTAGGGAAGGGAAGGGAAGGGAAGGGTQGVYDYFRPIL